MFTKTLFATAAFAAAVSAFSMPACWDTCFEKYQVDSEGCLCSDSLGSVVSSCIQSGCSGANSTAYVSWLSDYCNKASPSSNTWTAPVTSSVPIVYPSSVSVSIPAWTSGEASPTGSYAAASSSGAPYPTSSVCAYSTTLIWRGSTSVSVVTAGQSGWAAPTGYAAASGATWGAGATASSYAGPYATANAAPMATAGAGLAMALAGVAALL